MKAVENEAQMLVIDAIDQLPCMSIGVDVRAPRQGFETDKHLMFARELGERP
jgi:hypothetical protein